MPDETFIYHQNHPYKVFPIDYYMRDFEPKKRRNTARAEKLVEHPYIKDVLTDLIWMKDQPNQDYDYENGGRHPLPVEAETFLRCFSELLERPEYRDADREWLEEDSFKQRFSADLCMSIAESIFSSNEVKQYDDAAYCRHTLCENDDFCHTLVRGLWKRELDDRLIQIEQLAAEVPPTVQATILQGVLLILDKLCFDLIHCSKDRQSTHEPPAPGKLLEKLVSRRSKIEDKPPKNSGSKKRGKSAARHKRNAVYSVKNVAFKVLEDKGVTRTDLKAAFKALEDPVHPKPALMKQARLAYLKNLENEVQELPFEQKYLELQRYIDVVNRAMPRRVISQIFTDTVKNRCRGEMVCMMQTIRKKVEYCPPEPTSYLDCLLDYAARTRMTQSIQCFHEVRQLILDFYALSQMAAEIERRPLGLEFETDAGAQYPMNARVVCRRWRKDYFVRLQEMFSRYWVYTVHRKPIDKGGCFVDLKRVATKFVRGANDAAKFFGIDGEPLCSEYEMQILLKICENYAVQDDAQMPVSEIADISFTILLAAMIQILRRIAEEQIASLAKDFKALRAVQAAAKN